MTGSQADDALRNPDEASAPLMNGAETSDPNGGTGAFADPQATATFLGAGDDGTPSIRSAGQAPIPKIAGYEIVGVLGRGGMGVVYKARHLALKRVVALKMILSGGHADEGERQRFRSEAEAVARLQHPNIVQVHEVGEHEGLPYAALEFVEGGTLAQRLKRGPVPPREAAELIATAAGAMQLAHSRNIVHRDLKPANIMLGDFGEVYVIDWGVARIIGETDEGGPISTSGDALATEAGADRKSVV